MERIGEVLVALGLLFACAWLIGRWRRQRGAGNGRPAPVNERSPAASQATPAVQRLLVELSEQSRRDQAVAARRPVSAYMRVPLTPQQRELAGAALAFLRRDDAIIAGHFAVEADGLRAPCQRDLVSIFAARGLWPIETSLDVTFREGKISRAEKASCNRSLRSLEDKLYACLDEDRYRIRS